jgi:hypothetical protein
MLQIIIKLPIVVFLCLIIVAARACPGWGPGDYPEYRYDPELTSINNYLKHIRSLPRFENKLHYLNTRLGVDRWQQNPDSVSFIAPLIAENAGRVRLTIQFKLALKNNAIVHVIQQYKLAEGYVFQELVRIRNSAGLNRYGAFMKMPVTGSLIVVVKTPGGKYQVSESRQVKIAKGCGFVVRTETQAEADKKNKQVCLSIPPRYREEYKQRCQRYW